MAYDEYIHTAKLGTPEIAPPFVHPPGPMPKWMRPLSFRAQSALDEAKELFLAHIGAVPLEGLPSIQELLSATLCDRVDVLKIYAEMRNGGYILSLNINHNDPQLALVRETWLLVQELYKRDVHEDQELVSHHLTDDAGRQASEKDSLLYYNTCVPLRLSSSLSLLYSPPSSRLLLFPHLKLLLLKNPIDSTPYSLKCKLTALAYKQPSALCKP